MTFLGSNWERNLQIQGSPSSETFSDVSSGASSMPSEIAITDETYATYPHIQDLRQLLTSHHAFQFRNLPLWIKCS